MREEVDDGGEWRLKTWEELGVPNPVDLPRSTAENIQRKDAGELTHVSPEQALSILGNIRRLGLARTDDEIDRVLRAGQWNPAQFRQALVEADAETERMRALLREVLTMGGIDDA